MRQSTRQRKPRLEQKKPNRRRRGFVRFLACVVVFCTTYALILPAITLEKSTNCGHAEHTHTDSCYTMNLACPLERSDGHTHTDECYETRSTLICPLEESPEHAHTDECFETVRELTCPLEESEGHLHTAECYERVLTCTLEEHTHSAACYSDASADLETREQCEDTLPEKLSGVWADDLLAVAKSQMGYAESSLNYQISGSSPSGYTRYGAWYGFPYEEWCAMYIGFCLHYAAIPKEAMPFAAACNTWVYQLTEKEMYRPADGTLPDPGDIAFFDFDGDGSPDHAGIVAEADEKKGLETIEGNAEDKVARCRYKWDDPKLLGYGLLPENPEPPKEILMKDVLRKLNDGGTDAEGSDAYDISIPEGGYVNLQSIVEVLGIADEDTQLTAKAPDESSLTLDKIKISDKTKEFVESVQEVSFSRPDLVWVGKVEKDTTVERLKNDNDLEPQYSAELTDSQIARVNATKAEAGDWALISQKPFLGEQTLTVTTGEGEEYEITVRDGQISQTVLAADGQTYEVLVTYGADAQIPEGAELQVSEIPEGTANYQKYLTQTAKELETEAEDIAFARFFDIEIVAGGEKIEPAAEVFVKIQLSAASNEELQVIHFAKDGFDRLEATQTETPGNAAELKFTTDSFSTYGVISTPAQGNDYYAGKSFTISRNGQYLTSQVNNDDAHLFVKSTNPDDAALWTFEASNQSGQYYLSTTVNGVKQYMYMTRRDDNRAHAGLSSSPLQTYRVRDNGDGTYALYTNISGIDYFINEYQNQTGYAGYMWGGQEEAKLSLNFTSSTMHANGNYAMVVKYDDKYYIVLQDGTLKKVEYDPQTNRIQTDNPLAWLYYNVNGGSNLRIPVSATGFGGNQLANCFLYRLIDPTEADGYLDKDQGSSSNAAPTGTALQYDNHHLYAYENGTPRYIGIEIAGNGEMRIVGRQSGNDAAEILFFEFDNVPVDNSSPHSSHVVNHIDISIVGSSTVNIPLAYGDYYDEHGERIFTATPEDHIVVASKDVDITVNDIKNATVTATAYAKNPDGTNSSEKIEVPDAFFVTGYSGNEQNTLSTRQVRIEGSFKVAYLNPNDRYYNPANGQTYYGRDVNDEQNSDVRLDNRVYYTVEVTKLVTFPVVKDGQQLYDYQGHPLQMTVPVTLSASFDYWDIRNECPAVHKYTDVEADFEDNWWHGAIMNSGDTQSGMDFKLGTAESEDTADVLAVEIVKYIVDEHGNLLHPAETIENQFAVYEKLPNPVNSYSDDHNVVGVGIDRPIPADLYDDYTLLNRRGVVVGVDGMGQTYDYDVNALKSGMYYISEDQNSIPDSFTDVEETDWFFVKTYIKTESPWRNDTDRDGKQHTTGDYYKDPDDEDLEFNAIPEVLGDYKDKDGNTTWNDNGVEKTIRNGFLEFYVYNVYESKKGDVSFIKTNLDGDFLGGAEFMLFETYENGILRDELRKGDELVTAISDAVTGEVKFEDIRVGTYYMQETAAPPGFRKTDTVYKVVIEDKTDSTKQSVITYLDGTPLEDNSIANGPGSHGTVTFDKTDSGSQPVPGAEFTLYKVASCAEGMEATINDEIITATAASDGTVTFTASQEINGATVIGIPVGNYYMKETSTPGGFVDSGRRYFVHVGKTGDTDDTSFVAELETNPPLNGRTLEEYYRFKALPVIVNYRDTELVVRKQWLDYEGNIITNNTPVNLKLVQWVNGTMPSHRVTIEFRSYGNNNGGNPNQIRSIATREGQGAGDMTIQWDWNQWTAEASDEGGGDCSFEVLGLEGSTYTTTRTHNGVNYNYDGQHKGSRRTLTIHNITKDLNIIVQITNNNYDGTSDTLINQPTFAFPSSQESGIIPTDGTKTVQLGQNGDWIQAFSVAGDGLLTEDSTVLPMKYNGGDCVYTIAEESIPQGFTVSYSGSNANGIQTGVLTAYNKRTAVDITAIKVDSEDTSIRLNGASFQLTQIDPTRTGNMDLRRLTGGITQSGVTAGEGENKGTLVFSDLGAGYYEIRETNPPDGYVVNDDPAFYIRITSSGSELLQMDISKPAQDWSVITEEPMIVFRHGTALISNTSGAELPMTGGVGTGVIRICGMMLLLSSALLYLDRLRRKRERRSSA